tara:strand:+ start:8411 stop:9331 length:921 start_codon:yes stop_codon:yes gene_type:complete
MGFLDNSGDIILDAVLTDHGRKLLAKGDGSFQITKFALADDEINYTLYNGTHASGSAYYDVEILQTPVLEAFTDNAGSVKSKLISYGSMNLLYLPVIKINQLATNIKMHELGTFIVAVDAETEGSTNNANAYAIGYNTGNPVAGVIFGESLGGDNYIRLDQGIDSSEITPNASLDPDLIEDSYIVQIDNRLGKISTTSGDLVPEDYIDDDNIAYYTLDVGLVTQITDDTNAQNQTIAGSRGTRLEFKIASSIDLNTSTFLFTQLGGESVLETKKVRHIDSIVRVTGMKTGYSLDIPVRFVKTKIPQ